MIDKHYFPCGDCSLIFRTLGRLRNHMCKLQIKNPTFGSLYSKIKTCHLGKNKSKETEGIYDLEIDEYIIYCEIQWEALAQTISK